MITMNITTSSYHLHTHLSFDHCRIINDILYYSFYESFDIFQSGFSTLEQRHCCEIGKKWFEDNKGLCPTHPLYPHYFPPTNPFSPPQPINACLVSLEICCSDQQRKHSCRIAKKAAMVAKTCSLSLLRRKFRGLMISNGAGVDIKVGEISFLMFTHALKHFKQLKTFKLKV